MWIVAGVAAAGALYVLWTYRKLAALGTRDRAVLLGSRVCLLALALFITLRPMLLLKVAVPQQNFVGILLDDSRSMQVSDEQGHPRSDFVVNELGKPNAPLLAALAKRFVPRIFRFSSAAERLQTTADLTFQGTSTHFGDALDRARDELSGLPVAGLVVVTDGADNSATTLDQSIGGLKAQGIPVFPVGVGKERLAHDVQVTRAEAPRRALKGTSLVIDVVVTQTGYKGAKVPLIVEDEGRTVTSQDITLPGDGESETIKVRFKVADAGSRAFRFRIPVQDGEEVTQNNQRDVLIDVLDRREKLLYLEGTPRFEAKFIREATDADPNLSVAVLQRTAEASGSSPDKYLRLGVDGPEELQNGFPATRQELFSYRGIILGDVEASAFTAEQQRMLEDFVDVRGGGLLALGGPRAFAEGGWGGTPLSDALPITLERAGRKPLYPPLSLMVHPTRVGESHPATQITDREEDAAAKWRDLPPLTAANAVPSSDLKPGAVELLNGVDDRNHDQVVLAYQRYGRGKTLVLPVQDTWLWQMNPKTPADDRTHTNFWQRLTRWLVDDVPDRVMVTAAPDRVQRGEPVTLSADVVDPEYKGINDGKITAHVTAPSGKIENVVMDWVVGRDGAYQARFTPGEDGLYRVTVDGATRDGKDAGTGAVNLRVAPSDAEYFDAAMRAPLLKRLAEDTGGRFFTAADSAGLADAIAYSGKGITVIEERELWDMPIVFFLLFLLMGGEWLYRRSRNLA